MVVNNRPHKNSLNVCLKWNKGLLLVDDFLIDG